MTSPKSPSLADVYAAFLAEPKPLPTPTAPAPVVAPVEHVHHAPEAAQALVAADAGDRKAEAARQRRFAVEFVRAGRNSVEAARLAGYPRPSVDGPRVVEMRKVQDMIAERTALQLEMLDATPHRVVLELARLAFVDPRKAFERDDLGQQRAKHPSAYDDDTAAAIKKIEVGPLGTKVEFADKTAALALLTKVHGMQKSHSTVTLQGQVSHVHAVVGQLDKLSSAEVDELLALAPPDAPDVIEGEVVDQDADQDADE